MPGNVRVDYPESFPSDGPLARALRRAVRERIARGWSLNEIATEAGISQSVLQRWMTGERPDLRLSTADRLAQLFGLRLR